MTPYLFLLCLLSCSNSMTKTAITLPGKILTFRTTQEDFYYDNSDTPRLSFKIRDDKDFVYSGLAWFNTKDAFVGNEYVTAPSRMENRSNIVSFDLSGKITDRIYEAEKGEIAWAYYPSRDDKYLIFTTKGYVNGELNPIESLNPKVSLGILDIVKKKTIIKLDSLARESDLQIEESPWLQDGYRFVYSIGGGMQFVMAGEEQPINPSKVEEGLYIFDVATGKSSLLIPGGLSAIASPTQNSIAYEKDHCVIVRDLGNNKEHIIYKYKQNETILSKHWTPDGKFIYISYLSRSPLGELFKTTESKLIDASTGEEIPFKEIGMIYGSTYTWK